MAGSKGDVLIAAKTLSAVEVDPKKSNQHELNAGKLRQHLEIRGERSEGTLRILFYTDDAEEPEFDEDGFTFSDVRRGKPRSAEWRMYYKSSTMQRLAKEGDLLVVTRARDNSQVLAAVVARAGHKIETVSYTHLTLPTLNSE